MLKNIKESYLNKAMRFETLVVTVDRHDCSLAEKMNLQTDSLIGNQSDFTKTDIVDYNGHKLTFFNNEDRGVGKNRNLVLDHATADICILADDDMHFVDGYPSIMQKALELAPDADIWIFNLIEKQQKRYVIKEVSSVGYTGYAKFGAARIAVRRSSIVKADIHFSQLFGGGAKYGSGEDTIFLKECLDKNLKIVAVPLALAEMDQDEESTWFTGYNDKFFYDKGALYYALYKKSASLYILRYLIKYRNKYKHDINFFFALKQMNKGKKEFKINSQL